MDSTHTPDKAAQALIVLNLEPGATKDAIAKRFNEMYSDMQIRLTNAPTPNLKKLYQKNIQEIEDAFQALSGGEASSHDLPSSKPSLVADNSHTISQRPEARIQSGKPAGKSAPDKKPSNMPVIIALGLAILFLASAVLVFNLYNEQKKTTAELEKSLATFTENKQLYSLLENGKFKVKNTSASEIGIVSYIVMYVDNEKKMTKTYDYYDHAINIKPGQTYDFNKVDGLNTIWDGSVVAFTLELNYQGGSQIWAGFWQQMAKDNVLNIKLD